MLLLKVLWLYHSSLNWKPLLTGRSQKQLLTYSNGSYWVQLMQNFTSHTLCKEDIRINLLVDLYQLFKRLFLDSVDSSWLFYWLLVHFYFSVHSIQYLPLIQLLMRRSNLTYKLPQQELKLEILSIFLPITI